MLQQLSQIGEKLAHFLGEKTEFGVDMSSPTCKEVGKFFEHYRLQSLLPYRTYDSESGLFFNSNSTGFVLETYPMVGCTEKMQLEISGIFQHTLPEGSNLQVILYADPKVKNLLEYWSSPRSTQGNILSSLAQKRVEYLDSLVNDPLSSSQVRNFRCILAYSQPGIVENPVEKQKLLSLLDQVTTALKTLGMPVKKWEASDLLQTLDDLLNLKESTEPSSLKWNPLDSLDIQIPSSTHAYQVHKDQLVVNESEFKIRSYSVRQEPDYWSLHAMGNLIGDFDRDLLRLSCPFLIHYGIHVPNQEATKLRVQSRESWVEQQARSKIGKRVPIITKQSKELDFARHQLSKGERFVQTSFNVILFGKGEEIEEQEQTLLNLFRSHRWQLQRDPYIQLQTFLSTLPMNWGEGMPEELRFHARLKTTLSTEAANLLPLQAEWKGTESPGMLFVGRRGQLFTWSPFDNDAGNYNVAVVGRSGSGKSVFMQELMTSTLGQGGQVFVLDVGRSFEKVVKLLGGQYIEFSTKSPICINPFSTLPIDDTREASDALSMIKPIISLMAAPKEGTGDLENALIEKALADAWESKKREASITDVAEALLSYDHKIAQELGHKLYPYTEMGVYGRFFNGPANVDLSARMVVVELEELKERKDLQAVIVQMVILQITNKLYLGDRKTPSNLVLDEAWDMLRSKQSGEFIETAARRLRKYRGSLVVGTQSVNDFYETPGAQAAFDNSDYICLLSQKKESIEYLKKSGRILLDGPMEAQLASVKTKQGEYAETMIYGPHGYAIGRLLLDPFSLILYSTKPDEFAAVQSFVNQGHSMTEAIDQVVQLRNCA